MRIEKRCVVAADELCEAVRRLRDSDNHELASLIELAARDLVRLRSAATKYLNSTPDDAHGRAELIEALPEYHAEAADPCEKAQMDAKTAQECWQAAAEIAQRALRIAESLSKSVKAAGAPGTISELKPE